MVAPETIAGASVMPANALKLNKGEPVENNNKPIVFVVDDDPAVRNSLKFALELEGYQVRVYDSASAMLGAIDLPRSQCLVIDLKLPGRMDGLDLLKELRQRNITAPAILITSAPSATTRARAARKGIPIVEKPLLGNALSDSIRHAVSEAPRP
jgi:FixJ family two-component response regulator